MINLETIVNTYYEIIDNYEKSNKQEATLYFNDAQTIFNLITILSRKKLKAYFFRENDIKTDNKLFLIESRKIKKLCIESKDLLNGLYNNMLLLYNKYNILNKTIYLKSDHISNNIEIKDLILDYYSFQGKKEFKIAKELFDNNRIIEVRHNRYNYGAAFPLLSRNDGYITISRNKDALKYASTLVHEIGHIIDAYSINDIKGTNYHSKVHYLYSELLSCTHEYNFINFLYKNNLTETSKKLKIQYIDDYMHFCTLLYLIRRYNMINQDMTISRDKHKIDQLTKYALKNNILDDYIEGNTECILLLLSYTICFPLGIELSSIYKDNPKELNDILKKAINYTDISLEQFLYNIGIDKNRLINGRQIDEEFRKILIKKELKKTIK